MRLQLQAMDSFTDIVVLDLDMSVEKIIVNLVNDLGNYELPLLSFTLRGLKMTSDGTLNKGMNGCGSLGVYCDFYNYINGFWEPLLEPLEVEINDVELAPTKIKLSLQSITNLQLNLSTLLIKTCLEISSDLLVFLEDEDTIYMSKRKVRSHCTYVENHLGIDVHVYPESEHKSKRVSIHSMSNHAITLSGDNTAGHHRGS